MADAETINIRIKLQEAGAAREVRKVKNEIDDLGDSSERTSRKAQTLKTSAVQLAAGIGLASGSFAALGVVASHASPTLAAMAGAVTSLPAALSAAVPLLVAVSGAMVALGASAGAAALGVGALGVGAGGALAAGLAGVGIITARAASGFKDVTTAMDAHSLAADQYGRSSTQAAAAQAKLNAVVGQSGGPAILRAVRAYRALGGQFTTLTRSARASVAGIFASALEGAQRLLPAFAEVTNRSAAALSRGLSVAFRALSGSEMQASLRDLGGVFERIAGPLILAGTSTIIAFVRIARAAAPFVVRLAEGVERLAAGFASATRDPRRLQGIIGGFVGQARSWANLLVEVGRLVVAVLSPGASVGQGMVDAMTRGARALRLMAQSASGSTAIRSLFTDSAALAGAFGRALGPLLGVILQVARNAMPALTVAFRIVAVPIGALALLTGKLSGLLRLLAPVIGAVVGALWSYRVATIAAGVATRIWAAASKAAAAATWALNVAMRANPIGIVITLLIALGAGVVAAYHRFSWFRNGVQAVWSWLKTATGNVVSFVKERFNSFVGFMRALPGRVSGVFRGMWDGLKSGADAAVHWVADRFRDLIAFIGRIPAAIGGGISNIASSVGNTVRDALPFGLGGNTKERAMGGIVGRKEITLVGERGPELATFPAGTRITPAWQTAALLSGTRAPRMQPVPAAPARVQRLQPAGVAASADGGASCPPVNVETRIVLQDAGVTFAEIVDRQVARARNRR